MRRPSHQDYTVCKKKKKMFWSAGAKGLKGVCYRGRHLRRLIWVYTVWQCPIYGTLGLNGLNYTVKTGYKGIYIIRQGIPLTLYSVCLLVLSPIHAICTA